MNQSTLEAPAVVNPVSEFMLEIPPPDLQSHLSISLQPSPDALPGWLIGQLPAHPTVSMSECFQETPSALGRNTP